MMVTTGIFSVALVFFRNWSSLILPPSSTVYTLLSRPKWPPWTLCSCAVKASEDTKAVRRRDTRQQYFMHKGDWLLYVYPVLAIFVWNVEKDTFVKLTEDADDVQYRLIDWLVRVEWRFSFIFAEFKKWLPTQRVLNFLHLCTSTGVSCPGCYGNACARADMFLPIFDFCWFYRCVFFLSGSYPTAVWTV